MEIYLSEANIEWKERFYIHIYINFIYNFNFIVNPPEYSELRLPFKKQ